MHAGQSTLEVPKGVLHQDNDVTHSFEGLAKHQDPPKRSITDTIVEFGSRIAYSLWPRPRATTSPSSSSGLGSQPFDALSRDETQPPTVSSEQGASSAPQLKDKPAESSEMLSGQEPPSPSARFERQSKSTLTISCPADQHSQHNPFPGLMIKNPGADSFRSVDEPSLAERIVSRLKWLTFDVPLQQGTTVVRIVWFPSKVYEAISAKVAEYLTKDEQPVFASLYYQCRLDASLNKIWTTVATRQLPRPGGKTREDGWFAARCTDNYDCLNDVTMRSRSVLKIEVSMYTESSGKALHKETYYFEKDRKDRPMNVAETIVGRPLESVVVDMKLTKDGITLGTMVFVVHRQVSHERVQTVVLSTYLSYCQFESGQFQIANMPRAKRRVVLEKLMSCEFLLADHECNETHKNPSSLPF